MKHRRLRTFLRDFDRLPPDIQTKAVKAFQLFRDDPGYPSLNIELLEGTDGIWSGRIDYNYRWTFHYEFDRQSGDQVCVHRRIGTHEIYRNP
jgi:mRNA-degrading endonuclease RelE of RelBE toxin-antitoxin system